LNQKEDNHPETRAKVTPFSEISDVSLGVLDPVLEKDVKYKFKFVIHLKKSLITCYARTKHEMYLWCRIICRIIDINNGASEPFTGHSQAFNWFLKRTKNTSGGVKDKSLLRPSITYRSNDLDFNYNCVEGTLYKKINNVKVYHSSTWHTKYFKIHFKENNIKIFENADSKDYKTEINLKMVKDVTIEIEEQKENHKKRSSSFLGRLFSGSNNEEGSCPWLYEFKLITNDKTFTLRCANKDDRAHWFRIFRIILEMNAEQVSPSFFNPFDFEAKQKEITRAQAKEKQQQKQEKAPAKKSEVIYTSTNLSVYSTTVRGLIKLEGKSEGPNNSYMLTLDI
jgi:hypothetical protein